MRRGESVRDPADAPYAVALAVGMQRVAKRSWRTRFGWTWLLSVPAFVWWYFEGGIRLVALVFVLLVAFVVISHVSVRRVAPAAAAAEQRNREIARLHGLDLNEEYEAGDEADSGSRMAEP